MRRFGTGNMSVINWKCVCPKHYRHNNILPTLDILRMVRQINSALHDVVRRLVSPQGSITWRASHSADCGLLILGFDRMEIRPCVCGKTW